MVQFNPGDKVRVNEGLLEGQTGIVTESNDHLTLVKIDDTAFGGGDLAFFTQTLVAGDEDHESLAHLRGLYPDFLKAPKSENYRFRLTTYLNGVNYFSEPVKADLLVATLKNPPAGLEQVEFMLKNDNPYRGLAWKLLWSA